MKEQEYLIAFRAFAGIDLNAKHARNTTCATDVLSIRTKSTTVDIYSMQCK